MGGMFFGVDPDATTYYQKYVAPWFNLPSFSIGIFVLGMFSYLASAYLIGESGDKETRNFYMRCAQKTNLTMLIAGALVFLLAQMSRHPLLTIFFTNPVSDICFFAATVLTLILWRKIKRGEFTEWTIRLIAGSQVGFVLLAWFAVIFPNVLFYRDGTQLSLLDAAGTGCNDQCFGLVTYFGCVTFFTYPLLSYSGF